MYAETLKEILDNLQGYRYRIFWSHGNKLPTCFNKPISRALRGKYTHLWIVEEDMVIPRGTLASLLAADEEVIACDYPISQDTHNSVHYDPEGNAYFTGTGCMLLKPSAVEKFTTDIRWQMRYSKDKLLLSPHRVKGDEAYGFHDVTFGIKRYIQGKPIAISPIVLTQRKLQAKGKDDTNAGQDEIIEIAGYKKDVFTPLDYQEADGKLVKVLLNNKPTYIMQATADKLVAEGKAVYATKTYKNLTIDFESMPKLAREWA